MTCPTCHADPCDCERRAAWLKAHARADALSQIPLPGIVPERPRQAVQERLL